jgi:beta-fructofuranosidase
MIEAGPQIMDSAVDTLSKNKTGPLLNLRVAVAGEPHRPLYHFVAPANWMNDPNGAFLWKGKYHLFYQYNPNGPFWGTIHWGHAVSEDLVHWEDQPIALAPSKNSPDADGCWSGCIVNDHGVPTAFYTGLEPQRVCVATGDDDLISWTKKEPPAIAKPPIQLTGFPSITGHPSPDFRDPFVWSESDRWLMLIGTGLREQGGTALLYESKELSHWHYLGPVTTASIGANSNMWECPVLLRFGDRSVLLVCPHPEAKHVYWVAGQWRAGNLSELRRGKLDLGTYVYAAQTLYDSVRDRYLVWTWIKEGRTVQAQRSAGWSGLLSLPRECALDSDGNLVMSVPAELASLRGECRHFANKRFIASSENPLQGFGGDCLEIEAILACAEPAICSLTLRASPDHEERTTISYDSLKQTLTVDCTRSSLDSTVDHPITTGFLAPDKHGRVYFRAFLDRSVLEVFLGERQCITQRLYPTRNGCQELSFKVARGTALVDRMSVWKLDAIWPTVKGDGPVE